MKLKEIILEFDSKYAVIHIKKPLAYLSPKYYYQAVPLHYTKEPKIYISKGSTGVTISTKNIEVLAIFSASEKEQMEAFLNKKRAELEAEFKKYK